MISAVHAQNPGETKLTCSFSGVPLADVMKYLSTQSDVYFVYSSNKIDITKAISITVKDKPMSEILVLMGSQLNMVFRMEGRHVTIKGDDKIREVHSSPPSINKVAKSTAFIANDRHTTAIKYYFPPIPPSTSGLYSATPNLKKEFDRLQPYFDSTFLKQVPVRYVRKINTRNTHASFFLSAGPTLNDYSSGLELQAGIRQAYAVFAPAWLRNGDYHGAYGVGSSISLVQNFSFNPVYLFATVSGSESYFRIGNYTLPSQILVRHTAKHHQIKLMLQYSATPNVVVKVGPTLNQNYTTYKYHETPMMLVEVLRDPYGGQTTAIISRVGYANTGKANAGYGGFMKGPIYQDYTTKDFWVGWEASVSVKLNFLPRRIVASSH